MKVSFPFEYIGTNKFGKIVRPYATLLILKKDIGIYLQRFLVVDSGADFTMFPRKDAYSFGIDLKEETTRSKIFGVGGQEIVYLYENLEVKLGDIKLKIPCGFIDRNDLPALLGRQQFSELFEVCFKNYQTIFQSMEQLL